MTLLADWLGWLPPVAVVILWAETALLSALAPGPLDRLRALAPNATSGTCLLLALGVALRDGGAVWIVGLLALSLLAHALDVLQRLAGQRAEFSRSTE
ncbi:MULTISPECIES: hypothetical protein [Oceanibaculum]|uniref:CDP-diacylglycerol--glycerol-3-phosphate 3-phosphatidyltransferase n=1 Tax=Oceanibaculum indicum P24 TaxID=1207063 RepID=K2JNI5_9PROT|nr:MULTISPECIES: hypothetical protein [Oceanibaculum]EKE76037.1 hypothetical protein P24_08991 [Oceanibaculum indicum P24]MCH2394642.1 hypothetical protein [Oceanibaculum sp.]